MIPKASDLMETNVIAVGPDTPLVEVHRLFTEEQISGAPVVDDLGNVIGVITGTDLLRAMSEEHDTVAVETAYFREVLDYGAPDVSEYPEDLQDRLGEQRVSDQMTEGVISVPPSATAPEIARELRSARVHRLFVIGSGRLLGVVSAFDLLTLVEDWKEQ